MTTAVTERIVMQYWNAWQEPADWDAFRATLADDVEFNPGGSTLAGADALTEMLRSTESPWRDVTMLGTVYGDGCAALFYEGTDKATGVRTRVAEHLTIVDGLITHAVVAIVPLSNA